MFTKCGGSDGKESACHAGDPGIEPGLGRSPGEGNGYPLQYSGLENSMDCIVHGVAKSQTQLSDFHFHITNTLAWRIPWTEEPGGLYSPWGSQRLGPHSRFVFFTLVSDKFPEERGVQSKIRGKEWLGTGGGTYSPCETKKGRNGVDGGGEGRQKCGTCIEWLESGVFSRHWL